MHDRVLARKFERYRRRGDVAALGDVFDAAAPELARAASHLVRSASDVDDLVQATFLTALEKADAWDRERRLVPWLMGILVRHAHALRRDRGRTPDPRRVLLEGEPGRAADDPVEDAERAEASAALTAAVQALPDRYREVLEPLVLRGEPAPETAARLGRSPGTVRMQQSRGLDLLRRALPSGLALGLTAELGGRGLAAVRAEVLARAAVLTASGAAAPTTLLTTMTLAQKLAVGAAGVAALVGLLAWTARGPSGAEQRDVAVLAPDPANGAASLAPVSARPSVDGGAGVAAGAAGPGGARAEAGVERRPGDAAAALAAATGRVLEADGTPVAGARVELHAVGLDALERALTAPLDPVAPPAAFVGGAVTGPDGRFRIAGVRPEAQVALGVDLGGARPFARLVDDAFPRGGTLDLGDAVLPPTVPLAGRVLDERGAPVAGARVRVAATEGSDAWLPFLGLDVGTPVHVGEGLLAAVVEPPPWFREAARLLPIATATTGADGAFRFAHAPARGCAWFVDVAGLVPAWGAAPDADQGGTPDGAPDADSARSVEVRLARGRVLRGRVLDAAGRPVPGAQVRAGATGTLGTFGPPFTPLVQPARTDAQGDFEVTGLGAGDGTLLAARAADADAWTVTKVRDDGFQSVKLPSRHDFEVRLVDDAGAPVAGAELALARSAVLDGLATGAGLLDPWGAVARAAELGEGRYDFAGVAKGVYRLVARAPGRAAAEDRVVVRDRMREVVLTLTAPRRLAVRLVEEGSGEPIVGARVAVMERPQKERTLGAAVTDAAGVARIEVAAVELEDGAHLRVQHPAYGLRRLDLPRDAEGGAPAFAGPDGDAGELTELALAPAGSVRFRLRYEGPPPATPGMVELDQPGGPDAYPHYLHRRFGLDHGDGEVLVDGLAPGPWRAVVYGRYLDGDPLALLDGYWPEVRARVDVVVRAGELVEVDVPVRDPNAPTLPEGTGTLTVRVTRDGAPVTDRSVSLRGLAGLEGSATQALDGHGVALFERVPAGALSVSLEERQSIGAITFTVSEATEHVQLVPGEARTVEFAFTMGALDLRVLDEGGAPAPGVAVRAHSRTRLASVEAITDAEGMAAFPALHAGAVRLVVDDATRGVGALDADVPAGGRRAAELRLTLGVPCGGTVTAATPPGQTRTWLYLVFEPLGGGGRQRAVDVELRDGAGTFHATGLAAGRYRVVPYWGVDDGELAPLEVELPAGGNEALALQFERK